MQRSSGGIYGGRGIGGVRVSESVIIPWEGDEIRLIGDERSEIVNLFGPKWAKFHFFRA